jgi:drug/metabolite transporter (DMT)-like permease
MQALWMLAAAFFFATMAVCVKFASEHFNSAELVFYRGLLGMFFMWALARSRGIQLSTRYPGMHMWRSLVGVISLGAWFYAIAHLPLATAMTLNYMSSVWIAAFLVGGALVAWVPVPGRDGRAADRPPLQGALVGTVLAGFAGVVMILKPDVGGTGGGGNGLAGAVGLMSGLTAAFAYMQVVALSRLGEPETRTVFYFAVGSAVALPVGLLASAGQLCMTRAYASARTENGTLVVANLQYSGIVFAAIYSVVVFGDRIDALGWAGMALIIGSGIAATVLRQRSLPRAPAEEH